MPTMLVGKPKTVVMSGGAPQSPLMAGFLYALWEKGRTFRRFHTSGAGALMALLFLSPSKRFSDPGEALQNWVEAGVSDEIYRVLPQNFKLFHKPGPFAPIFNRLAERFKVPIEGVPGREVSDPVGELMVDTVARLAGYNSQLDKTLRKDPVEQFRDALTALWMPITNIDVTKRLIGLQDPIRRLRQQWIMSLFPKEEDRRLYNDMVDLFFSALAPSTLTSRSLGMAAPLPFLDEIVNFNRDTLWKNVNDIAPDAHLCVNAYNMTLDAKVRATRRNEHGSEGQRVKGAKHYEGRRDRCQERKDDRDKVMQFFYEPYPEKDAVEPSPESIKKHDGYPITANGIRAAFSMPFIYPPARIGDDYFSEGADHEPINLRHIKDKQKDLPFVLLDVLGELEDYLVRKPRDLWDAYVISIMTPVVALANEDIADFRDKHGKRWTEKMLSIEWEIPAEAQAFVMDWSRSNMQTLFKVGRKAGEEFLADHASDLDPHPLKKGRAKTK